MQVLKAHTVSKPCISLDVCQRMLAIVGCMARLVSHRLEAAVAVLCIQDAGGCPARPGADIVRKLHTPTLIAFCAVMHGSGAVLQDGSNPSKLLGCTGVALEHTQTHEIVAR